MSDEMATTQSTAVEIFDSRSHQSRHDDDDVAVEIPVALRYNCLSHAVMMASPVDLEDFAIGFSLTEEIVSKRENIYSVHVTPGPEGATIRMQIADEDFDELKSKRRNMVGRTGCGLCGTETLKQAIRPIPAVTAPKVNHTAVDRALTAIREAQPINHLTGATHAAAWCAMNGDIVLVREDVGRHNALDKLIGALSDMAVNRQQGFILVTSRASYEMVQKTCMAGIGCLVAISAPTSLAIDQARQAGLLLIGFARANKQVIYHDPNPSEILSRVI